MDQKGYSGYVQDDRLWHALSTGLVYGYINSNCLKVFGIVWCAVIIMAQGSLVGKSSMAKSEVSGVQKLRIKIPKFDNTELIKGYQKTLIGRRMNPLAQNVDNLLYMLPKIWNVEERVSGGDIGNGCFQFDFTDEEDITRILKTEPFHFDRWMISLVRWEPRVDSHYPSEITFWIKVMGLPLQFWAEPTFQQIGGALGKLQEIDIDMGRIKVIIDGFKPLHFSSVLEFDEAVEVEVSFHYERLHGFCRICHSLCHSDDLCGQNSEAAEHSKQTNYETGVKEPKMLSYRGALGSNGDKGSGKERVGAKRALAFTETERGARDGKSAQYEGRSKESHGKAWVKKGRQQAPTGRNLAARDPDANQVTYGGRKETNKVIDQSVNMSVLTGEDSDKSVRTEELSSLETNNLNAVEEGRVLNVESDPLLVPPGMETDEQGQVEQEGADFIKDLMSFDGLEEGADLEDLLGDTDMLVDNGADAGVAAKVTEVLEVDHLAKMVTGKETHQTVRKKAIPPSPVGRGLSLRKRNALLFGSPRKRVLNKRVTNIGEGLYPKKAAGASKAVQDP